MSYGSVDMYAEMSDSKHVYNTSTGLACVLYNMLARSLARPVSSCTYFTPEFRCAANANGWYQPTITPPFSYEDPHVYPLPIGRQSAHLEQESPRTRALIRPYAVLSVILRLALTYLHLFPSQRLLVDRTSPIANRLYDAILPIYRPSCPPAREHNATAESLLVFRYGMAYSGNRSMAELAQTRLPVCLSVTPDRHLLIACITKGIRYLGRVVTP